MTTKPFRYIGVTDECTTCEQCGKPNLAKTIVIAALDADGTEEAILYYGSTCAARALGYGTGQGATVRKAATAAKQRTLNHAHEAQLMLDLYDVPADGDEYDINQVAAIYRDNHAKAAWAPTVTWEGWKDRARDMIVRKRAAVADAELVTH